MTLYRQLLIFVITLLVVLFTGIWGEKLQTTRTFLINQMESHAQDTATSLGLSLTTFINEMDTPAMETMISAVFDRGYYRNIELNNIEGRTIVSRKLDIEVEGVPPWFIKLVPLSVPEAESLIMNNWQRSGTITVESHPGFAYKTLWETALSTALWFSAAVFGTAFLGGLGLHLLLRPLTRVEEQALALCESQYNIQEKIPHTRELGRVVVAMNQMTRKVQEMFSRQAKAAETLFQQTYLDPVTDIGNRRFLESQVLSKATEKEGPVQGAFLIIHLKDLQSLNNTLGYNAGDTLLKELALIIRKAGEKHGASIARLGGADFGIFLPNADIELAGSILSTIVEQSMELPTIESKADQRIIAGGGVIYETNVSFTSLLKKADQALRAAIHNGSMPGIIQDYLGDAQGGEKSRAQWKELLEKTLEDKSLRFFFQKTVNMRNPDEVAHFEILTRIKDCNQEIRPAGQFIPVAEHYDLITFLDELVVEKILTLPMDIFQPKRLALNISPTSLADDAFYSRLLNTLRSLPPEGPKFNFEFAEIKAVKHLPRMQQFIRDIKELGHYVGIDHFGQGLIHFGYLQSLMPDYIKIDRAITRKINAENNDNVFFISSICHAAHSLDIRVIVEGIETKDQLTALQAVSVDAVQGYYVQTPEPIPLTNVNRPDRS